MKNTITISRIVLFLMVCLLVINIGSSSEDISVTDYNEIEVYNDEYVCKSTIILLNGSEECTSLKKEKVYSHSEFIYDGIIRLNGKEIRFDDHFCSINYDEDNIHCVHVNDGYHPGKAVCSIYGGMTCKIVKIYSKHSYSITDVYGEIYTDSKKIRYKSI